MEKKKKFCITFVDPCNEFEHQKGRREMDDGEKIVEKRSANALSLSDVCIWNAEIYLSRL